MNASTNHKNFMKFKEKYTKISPKNYNGKATLGNLPTTKKYQIFRNTKKPLKFPKILKIFNTRTKDT